MRLLTLILTGLALTAPAGSPAVAAVTSYTIKGTDSGDPSKVFSGDFSLDYTNSVFSLVSFNATYDGVTFDLSNSGIAFFNKTDVFLGGDKNYRSGIVGGVTDFYTDFFRPPSSGEISFSGLLARDDSESIFRTTFTVANVSAASAVPEPTTWVMLLLGFGMIGAASRYRHRSARITLT